MREGRVGFRYLFRVCRGGVGVSFRDGLVGFFFCFRDRGRDCFVVIFSFEYEEEL